VPDVVRLKTFVTKVVGVVAAVSGGLAVGKVSICTMRLLECINRFD